MEFILQEVGENEFSLVHERLINAQQLKKISKANIGEFCVWDLQWGLLRSLNQANGSGVQHGGDPDRYVSLDFCMRVSLHLHGGCYSFFLGKF